MRSTIDFHIPHSTCCDELQTSKEKYSLRTYTHFFCRSSTLNWRIKFRSWTVYLLHKTGKRRAINCKHSHWKMRVKLHTNPLEYCIYRVFRFRKCSIEYSTPLLCIILSSPTFVQHQQILFAQIIRLEKSQLMWEYLLVFIRCSIHAYLYLYTAFWKILSAN